MAVPDVHPDAGGTSIGSIAPNPSVGANRLMLSLRRPAPAEVCVYSASGRLVRNLYHGVLPEGRHTLVWDGRDESARVATPGIYFWAGSVGGQRFERRSVKLH